MFTRPIEETEEDRAPKKPCINAAVLGLQHAGNGKHSMKYNIASDHILIKNGGRSTHESI